MRVGSPPRGPVQADRSLFRAVSVAQAHSWNGGGCPCRGGRFHCKRSSSSSGRIRLGRVRADLVHTLGAIVPNRVDIADLHFCHAGFLAATGRLAPAEAPPLRKLNTSLARLLALAAERWCYRPSRLRRFAAVSEGVGAELARYYPGVPVSVVPNGVDLERYHRDPDARQAIRAAEGVTEDDVVALFVGGDWDRKGLPLIIAALAHAPHVRLWVMGPGDEARATAYAREFGVQDRLRILGHRTDGERYYSAADMFCLASLYETFSLAAHEAAAAQLPIVSTPVSGVTRSGRRRRGRDPRRSESRGIRCEPRAPCLRFLASAAAG